MSEVPSLELSPRRGFALPRFTAVAIAGVLAVVAVGTIVVMRPGHSEPVHQPRRGDFDKVVQALMGCPGVDQIVRSRASQ